MQISTTDHSLTYLCDHGKRTHVFEKPDFYVSTITYCRAIFPFGICQKSKVLNQKSKPQDVV